MPSRAAVRRYAFVLSLLARGTVAWNVPRSSTAADTRTSRRARPAAPTRTAAQGRVDGRRFATLWETQSVSGENSREGDQPAGGRDGSEPLFADAASFRASPNFREQAIDANAVVVNADGTEEPSRSSFLPWNEAPAIRRLYRVAACSYAAAASLLLLTPSRFGSHGLASKFGSAAGFGIACVVSSILSQECGGTASRTNRCAPSMDADAFRRSVIGLLGFSLLGLPAVPAEASYAKSLPTAILTSSTMTVSRIIGTYTAVRTIRGVLRHDTSTVAHEFLRGVKSNIRGLRVRHKKRAATYRNCLLLILAGIFSACQDIAYSLANQQFRAVTPMQLTLNLSKVARLLLISSLIYTLKDAAEQNKLGTDNSITMNCAVATWAFLVGLSQTTKGTEMMFFSLIFVVKGYKGKRKKNGTLRVFKNDRRWRQMQETAASKP